MWTPESNKWVNPKYDVKETPQEQLDYALGFYKNKAYKETIRELQKLLQHYPKAKQAPEAQFYLGQVYEDQDNLYQAFKEYQTVIDKYPFSELSAKIIQKEYAIAVELIEGKTKKGTFLDVFKDEYSVVDIFRTIIKNAPYGELAAQSQYKIALYLQEKKMYQEARDEFEKTINDYPESEWAKAAKYQIAKTDSQRSTKAAYDQKVTQSAVKEYEEFLKTNPDAELSKQAKDQVHKLRDKEAENNFMAAKFYEKQKNYKSAKIYYQTIVDDYSESSWAPQALKKIRELSGKE
ncbi:MAG: outer membrane protein assembly factor BamD [Candidatus Omnitrophica bacterium]|nr:outer membrane protein assembly factor BamD [Candidatus Omnitrophota bacterium]